MAQTTALVGIFGAVDRAAAEDPSARDAVARVLPIYETDVRWFDEFHDWTQERRGGTDGEAFPSLGEALATLAERPPRGRERGRRLFAVGLAARAFPEVRQPGTDLNAAAKQALIVDSDVLRPEDPQPLLELLADDTPGGWAAPQSPDEWWERALAQAAAENLLMGGVEEYGPRPCTGRLVKVGEDGAVAAALTSSFGTDRVTFENALSFLEPSNWPNCCDFWCSVDLQDGSPRTGVRRYREVVSTDCDAGATAAWSITADLDFTFWQTEAIAIAEYVLSDGHPQAGDDVLVDEGSLVIQRLATGGIRMTTTKRVRFNHPFSGEALALIMCALGYASIVEHIVFTCALRGGNSGTRFPPDGTEAGPAHDQAGEATTAGPYEEPPTDEQPEQQAAPFASCIDYTRTVYDRLYAGRYSADEAVKDATEAWVRLLRETAATVQAGARATQAPSRPRGPRRRMEL